MSKRLLVTPQNPNGILEDVLQSELLTDQQKFDASMSNLREKRNILLAETDYIITKHTEAGTAIPTEWKTYRTALRNITNNLTTVDDVNGVTWPTKPSE